MSADLLSVAPTELPAVPRGRRWNRALALGGGLWLGVTVIAAVLAMSFLVEPITGHDPNELLAAPLQPPSGSFWFGTDTFGRDVFVRAFVAARTDYVIAVLGVGVSLVAGTALGVLAASARRPMWDRLLMRTTDALIAIPFPLLVLVIVLSIGSQRAGLGLPAGALPLLIAIWSLGWSVYARLARTATRTLMGQEFVTAAHLMGFSRRRLVLQHLVPNVLPTTSTFAISDVIIVIGLTGGLAFLGAGVVQPTPEWGSMIFEGRNVLASAWWLTLFPVLLVILTGVAVSMIANGFLNRTERS